MLFLCQMQYVYDVNITFQNNQLISLTGLAYKFYCICKHNEYVEIVLVAEFLISPFLNCIYLCMFTVALIGHMSTCKRTPGGGGG